MANLDAVFTYEYAQPADYHFCQDSVLLPKLVAAELDPSRINEDFQALDLCAGCGVIGFELAFFVPAIERFDFIEIQPVFADFFRQNLLTTGHDPENFRLIQANYEVLISGGFRERYDLIVSNPPYFFAGEGRPSPSEVKNRCRFFLDSSFEKLIEGIIHSLKPQGQAFILMKSGHKHGRDMLRQLRLCLADKANESVVADLRGTLVIRIDKPRV